MEITQCYPNSQHCQPFQLSTLNLDSTAAQDGLRPRHDGVCTWHVAVDFGLSVVPHLLKACNVYSLPATCNLYVTLWSVDLRAWYEPNSITSEPKHVSIEIKSGEQERSHGVTETLSPSPSLFLFPSLSLSLTLPKSKG